MMQRLLSLGLLGSALAHPTHNLRSSTWKPDLTKRVVDLEQYRVSAVASYSNATVTKEDPAARVVKRDSYVDTATALVQSVVPGAEFRVSDHYVGTNGVAVSMKCIH